MDNDAWNRRYEAVELVWSAEPNRYVEEELRTITPGRALDLAAGEGRNSLFLSAGGWHTTAVDFSTVAIEKARSLEQSLRHHATLVPVDWVVADITTYVPQTGAFDLVLLCYVHLPCFERREVFARAGAALSDGGILLVVGHDTTNLTEGTGGPQDPELLFGPEDVVRELPHDLSFTIERAERVRRPVEGARDAIDVVVRALRRGASPLSPNI